MSVWISSAYSSPSCAMGGWSSIAGREASRSRSANPSSVTAAMRCGMGLGGVLFTRFPFEVHERLTPFT